MQDFKQKNKNRKLLYSLPVRIFLLVLFLFLASRVFDLYKKESEVRAKAFEVHEELAKVQEREHALQKKVDFMNTARGKEEELRSRFMVGKSGEGVIMVVDQKPTTTASVPEEKRSRWGGFFKIFR